MRFHELKPTHPYPRKKRIGRGGKRGTYSGRGIKGQKARAGHKIKPMERELLMKIPKLRGIKFKSQATKPMTVAVGEVDRHFRTGERVTPETIMLKGLIRKVAGRRPEIKLLGKGKVTKALLVERCQLSAGARQKIIDAGGAVK